MQAIPLLEEVVRIAPNLPDAYYILGLIYDAMGNRKKALNFHMIAAHLSPKDPALWRKLIAWSMYALLDPDNLTLCNLNSLNNNPSTCLARISCHFFVILIYFNSFRMYDPNLLMFAPVKKILNAIYKHF